MTRVVITGLGVCSPNGTNLESFEQALISGTSGIRFQPQLRKLKFSCQIAGNPNIENINLNTYFTKVQQRGLNSSGLVYGMIAGQDAWRHAGLLPASKEKPDWDSGVVFGTGILGVDKFREAIHKIDEGETRRLGSSSVIQTMASGISAYLGGTLGLGNQVTTNSSACTTGTESLIMGFERIRSGKAKRMLVGSCSDSGPYVWGGFDAMRILPSTYNERPTEASRPMSASAAGFVPGSGAGALVLESLESALERGAPIYGEVKGSAINSGGQRGDGSMTAPNSEAVQHCIRMALKDAGVSEMELDAINGHLTATTKDSLEVLNWTKALGIAGSDFPLINSFKGHVGHCLAAAGSIECVATVMQLYRQMVFGNVNCGDIHPEILSLIDAECIPTKSRETPLQTIAKASFGFGDVNACVIFSQYIA